MIEKIVTEKILRLTLLADWATCKAGFYYTPDRENNPVRAERYDHYHARSEKLYAKLAELRDNHFKGDEYVEFCALYGAELNRRAAKLYPWWFNGRFLSRK